MGLTGYVGNVVHREGVCGQIVATECQHPIGRLRSASDMVLSKLGPQSLPQPLHEPQPSLSFTSWQLHSSHKPSPSPSPRGPTHKLPVAAAKYSLWSLELRVTKCSPVQKIIITHRLLKQLATNWLGAVRCSAVQWSE
jgi:hypothetical protein